MGEQILEAGQIERLEEQFLTLEDLITYNYPRLVNFDHEHWSESKLDILDPNASNSVASGYNQLSKEDQTRASEIVTAAAAEELLGLSKMSKLELSARKCLSHLEATRERLDEMSSDQTDRLRMLQSIREVALIEVQRRARQKMLAEGGSEHLSGFTSRFLFGPPPPKKTHGNATQLDKPTEGKFFLAKVGSGKEVAVQDLNFDIPDVYKYIIVPMMKEKGLWTNTNYYYNSCYVPTSVEQAVALEYYKLGFKPSDNVTVYYKFRPYGYNSGGWYFSHSRHITVDKLVPID